MANEGPLIDFYPYRARFRTYHRPDRRGRDRDQHAFPTQALRLPIALRLPARTQAVR
jgi:hypothetical protein